VKRVTVVLLIAVVGFVASGCEASGAGLEASKSLGKPEVKVEAKKILKEFENNEAAADVKYKGKTIQVSGIVDKDDTEMFEDEKYSVQVGAETQFELVTVNCNGQTSKNVTKIKKGQKITVVGAFDDGGDLGVELEPCQIK